MKHRVMTTTKCNEVNLTWFKRTQANCLDVRHNNKLLYKNLIL